MPDVDLESINAAFRDFVPHNRALSLEVTEATFEPAIAVLRLPYDGRFAGDPDSGVLHGGVITTLLDACAGASVYFKLQSPTPIATLDLRIDYLKPATAGRDVFARAECFHVTHNVAFVRAIAYHDTAAAPIAVGNATFALSTQGRPAVPDVPAAGAP
ncbi:MAG: PaaI family thioesterase [Myxococcales bacterium]|nr:PaaI family thioesterase [Myxococcales bacterium]